MYASITDGVAAIRGPPQCCEIGSINPRRHYRSFQHCCHSGAGTESHLGDSSSREASCGPSQLVQFGRTCPVQCNTGRRAVIWRGLAPGRCAGCPSQFRRCRIASGLGSAASAMASAYRSTACRLLHRRFADGNVTRNDPAFEVIRLLIRLRILQPDTHG